MPDNPSPAAQFLSLLEQLKSHDSQIHTVPVVIGSMTQDGIWQQWPPENVHHALVEKSDRDTKARKDKSDLLRDQVAQAATSLIVDARRLSVTWDAVLRLIGTWEYRKHYLDAWTQAKTLAAVWGNAEDPEMFPADHFSSKFGIPADTLKKARNNGRIEGKKRGNRWFYALRDVKKLWPDAFSTQ